MLHRVHVFLGEIHRQRKSTTKQGISLTDENLCFVVVGVNKQMAYLYLKDVNLRLDMEDLRSYVREPAQFNPWTAFCAFVVVKNSSGLIVILVCIAVAEMTSRNINSLSRKSRRTFYAVESTQTGLVRAPSVSFHLTFFQFLADRTNGRAIATLLRLSSSSSSVVCDVMYCG